MDMSMLQKLLTMDPANIQNLSNAAAMKAAPPQIGPGAGGGSILAPGAFAGIMDPTVGQVPQGVQAPGGMPMGMPPQAAPAAAAANPGFNAQQAGVLSGMAEQAPLHFPGTAYFQRPGNVAGVNVPVPQAGNQQATLAQLLGR